MIKNNNFDFYRGFTLVEMLVAIAVFMTVMVIAIGSFISIVNANKKSQAMKSVVDNVTFAIDSISRSMKVGTNYKCSSDFSSPENRYSITNDCPDGGKMVQYYDETNNFFVQYAFVKSENIDTGSNEGNIQKRICNLDNKDCETSWHSLTGPVDNINIKNMKFYVLGTGTEIYGRDENRQRRQPRVIITVEGSSGESTLTSNTSFMLQTSISQMDRITN